MPFEAVMTAVSSRSSGCICSTTGGTEWALRPMKT
jgi:hypothetical protein